MLVHLLLFSDTLLLEYVYNLTLFYNKLLLLVHGLHLWFFSNSWLSGVVAPMKSEILIIVKQKRLLVANISCIREWIVYSKLSL